MAARAEVKVGDSSTTGDFRAWRASGRNHIGHLSASFFFDRGRVELRGGKVTQIGLISEAQAEKKRQLLERQEAGTTARGGRARKTDRGGHRGSQSKAGRKFVHDFARRRPSRFLAELQESFIPKFRLATNTPSRCANWSRITRRSVSSECPAAADQQSRTACRRCGRPGEVPLRSNRRPLSFLTGRPATVMATATAIRMSAIIHGAHRKTIRRTHRIRGPTRLRRPVRFTAVMHPIATNTPRR